MSAINILIIDDHPLLIEGYKSILTHTKTDREINITSVLNCESAFTLITDPKNSSKFDVAFVDLSLPAYLQQNIMGGADLIGLVQTHFTDCKVIVITSHSEAFLLYNIEKKHYPDGILIKSDFTATELIAAFEKVLEGHVYYSETVRTQLKAVTAKVQYLDTYNRQIILLLSQGIKSKNLPDYLPLSMSAIDKRKAQIKDYFLIEKGTDEDIIKEAKKCMLI